MLKMLLIPDRFITMLSCTLMLTTSIRYVMHAENILELTELPHTGFLWFFFSGFVVCSRYTEFYFGHMSDSRTLFPVTHYVICKKKSPNPNIGHI